METTGYTQKIMEYFRKPHNYGRLKDYNGLGKVGNPVCGDVMYLYIKVGQNKKKEEIIKNISFETFGCVAAISTSSVITDLAKNKTIKEALQINKDKVADALGGLPPLKMHCSLLAIDALSEAIYDYLSKNKKPIPEELKQRRQRIERHKKITEERYKKWSKKEPTKEKES